MSLRVCVFPEHVCAAGLALTTTSKNAINSVLMQGPALETKWRSHLNVATNTLLPRRRDQQLLHVVVAHAS